jgi:diguanylate cyclase (GGDEF)-like protein
MVLAGFLVFLYSIVVLHIKNEEYQKAPINDAMMVSRALGQDYAELLLLGLPSSSIDVRKKWASFPMIAQALIENTTGVPVLYFSRDKSRPLPNDTSSVSDGYWGYQNKVMFEGRYLGTVKYQLINLKFSELKAQVFKLVLVSAPIALFLAFVLSLLLRRIFTRPLDELIGAVSKITAERDYSTRIQVNPKDKSEYATFSQRFNALLERIEITFSDVEKSKAHAQKLAYYDVLTGLANRRLLGEHLESVLNAIKGKERYGALLFIDLDYFKNLNDSRGHVAGDDLLKQVSERLREVFRADDTLARLGGDEFVVVLDNSEKSKNDITQRTQLLLTKLKSSLDERFVIFDESYRLTVSTGIAVFSGEDASPEAILSQADCAMYYAKECGRDGHKFFQAGMKKVADERVQLEKELREVVEKDALKLHYQPFVDNEGKIVGAEALLRWERDGVLVQPVDFIPVAEKTGLIVPIGEWVLNNSFVQLQKWQAKGLPEGFKLSINISPFQFRQDNFLDKVKSLLDKSGVDARKLKFEVTESLLISELDSTIEKMKKLIALGIDLSMDDFGTGYSSLMYLKKLPIKELKIDQTFVRDINVDKQGDGLAATIIAMARNLGLDVVAEGVENERQLLFLQAHGCSCYQGFYFYKPMEGAELEKLIL